MTGTTKKNPLENVMYNYTAESSDLEEQNRILKETLNQLTREIERLKESPLMIAEVKDLKDEKAIISLPNGNMFYVNNIIGNTKIKPGDHVAVDQKNLNILQKIDISRKFNVDKFVIVEKPNVSWKAIGGLRDQVRELHEVIELPLKNPEIFRKVGIQPPKGVLLHGEPGTGKTLLAKAVATSTKAVFIEIVGSELVQKFIGEGAKLVKEIFELARRKAPAIIFIDELDSIASRRIEVGTSGEREVQRTFMQLLAEIDGFKHLGNVKIIGCTNRKDILDPAVIRPGRLDRLIKVPLPDALGIKEIFKIHTKDMDLRDCNMDNIVRKMHGFSGASIRAACTEAGYFAVRSKRTHVTEPDFKKAVVKVKAEEEEEKEFQKMFG